HTAPNQVRVGGAVEQCRKCFAPTALCGPRVARQCNDLVGCRRLSRISWTSSENPAGLLAGTGERPTELARRREVFGVVQAALTFRSIEKLPVPIRRMPVSAIRKRRHLRKSVIGSKRDCGALTIGVEMEGSILMMHR